MRLFANYSANYVEGLDARIAALEQELEQAKADRNRAAMDARNPLLTRLAALEAEAKQAREDEAWALSNQIEVKALEHGKWKLTWWTDKLLAHSFDGSFHAALRSLRAKVEVGAR